MKELPALDLRLKGKLIPATVAILLALHLLLPHRGWWILLLGLGGAWLISYLWARSLLYGLRLEREADAECTEVGDVVSERFSLVNRSPVPALWVELQDHSNLPDYQASAAKSLAARRSAIWSKQYACKRRGVFSVGPSTLKSGDPFGIYQVSVQYRESHPVMILPPVVPLQLADEILGERGDNGSPRDRAIERTVCAAGVREYQPGDSLRWIHWRTSARRDDLFVRMFDSTPGRRYWILVDMDGEVQVGEGSEATDEHAVVLAASLAEQSLMMGHAVGLGAYGKRLAWVPPREGLGQRWEIMSALAQLSRGPHPLARLLERSAHKFRAHVGVILITPAVNDGSWLEALLPLLQRGAVCTTLLLDPASYGGTETPGALESLLPELGVQRYIITREFLGRLEDLPLQPLGLASAGTGSRGWPQGARMSGLG
jgi:uncharacterized protein (DUF58 family)